MDTVRWERLWEIFEEALAKEPASLTGFLERACEGDADLRRELDSLLASHVRAGAFLEEAVGAAAAAVASGGGAPGQPSALREGQRLGPWEIQRPLGSGGMGAVYLAVRSDDQFRQQAALKLARVGLDDPDLIRRFRSERQILADLDHPNIARLLDGGAAEDGAPYVVMEYVDGERIDRWCDARRLGLRERLALFLRVCSAVQHAHRSLVVHRDIKPANILVTPDGTPKLLDFGIAKLLDPEGPGAGGRETRTVARFLTPDYASPEQVRGAPITTSADVYSLGVLLYELLTGRLPFRTTSGSPADLVRIVCETAPEKPSAAVMRDGAAASPDPQRRGEPHESLHGVPFDPIAASRARGTTPDGLRRELQGDLDNIILMALRKEPERRYSSVEQMSEDVLRYLERRPVAARGDSWRYRAEKFVRRNRWGVAAAAAILLLLVGLAVSMTWLSLRIADERDRAREAEGRATTEAVTAGRVSEFLVELFGGVDPEEARGREVTAREILDRGAVRIRTELREQPGIQARLKETIGRVYGKLGLYDEARPLLEESLRRRIGLYGEEHPEVARAQVALGSLLTTLGEYGEAERLLVAALAERRRLPGGEPDETIRSLSMLGTLRSHQGRYDEAEACYREALALARAAHGDRHEIVADALSSVGWILDHKGQYGEAEAAYREALAMQTEILTEEHPSTAGTLGLLGALLRQVSRYEESREMHLRVLELRRRVYGEEHVTVAIALNNLASLLKEMAELEGAEARQREALAMYRKVLGEEHPLTAMALNNLANILHDKGDYEGAEAAHRKSLALHRKILGDEHPRVGDCLNNLANLLWDVGDYDAAEPIYREAVALDRKLLGDDHPYVAMDVNNLALVLRDRGDLDGALPLVEEAVAISSRAEGADSPTTALYVSSLAALYQRMGRLAEAEAKIEETLRIQEGALPEGHWRIHQSRWIQGEILAARGRPDEAERVLLAAHEGLEGHLGQRNGMTRRARESLQRFYLSTGRPAKAAAYASSR